MCRKGDPSHVEFIAQAGTARTPRLFEDALVVPDNMFFDGRRLVDVEWNRVRIISVSGVALTQWLKLPQPPGFAELVDDGRLLLLTTGPELRAYDTATLHLRYPPIPLTDSPERLRSNVDGSRVLLSFGGSSADGFVEHLQVFDARQDRRLPGEAVLPGQLRHLAFSADSTRILAVGPTAAATTVFADCIASASFRTIRSSRCNGQILPQVVATYCWSLAQPIRALAAML